MNTNAVTLAVAKQIVEHVLARGLAPMVSGSPGLGKSEMIHQIAHDRKLKVIDIRLAQCDPTDLNGFPFVDPKTGKASYLPMSTFPLEGEPLPEGYNGWILFLDEITSANMTMQAGAYKLILDKMVGQKKLHPNCFVIGAGNLETDNAVVEPMSTALASRMVHIHIKLDLDSWMNWALGKGEIDHRITAYIGWKKESALYNFTGATDAVTYACPRTWKFCSDLIKGVDRLDSEIYKPMINGTVSEGVGREFVAFLDIYKSLPDLDKILKDPMGIKLPGAMNVQYALIGALASVITADNADAAIKFIGRMEKELQFYAVRYLSTTKRSEVINCLEFSKWVRDFSAFMTKTV